MLSVPSSPSAAGASLPLDGPVEELIVSGTAFGWLIVSLSMRVLIEIREGYGLFNLVFSLLPKKVQYVYSMLLRKIGLLTIIEGVSLASLASNTIESWLSRLWPWQLRSQTSIQSLLGQSRLHTAEPWLTPISLVLMTYYGVVLLMSGYQADEAHIVKQYRAIVDKRVTLNYAPPLSDVRYQGSSPNIRPGLCGS